MYVDWLSFYNMVAYCITVTVVSLPSKCCLHSALSFHAVMLLSHGRNVSQAASEAVAPIAKAYPRFSGAVIVADSMGNFGEMSGSLLSKFIASPCHA